MGRKISSFTEDTNIGADDKLLGTDSSGNTTVNFEVSALASYVLSTSSQDGFDVTATDVDDLNDQDDNLRMWAGTQAEYDAIGAGNYLADVLYFVI